MLLRFSILIIFLLSTLLVIGQGYDIYVSDAGNFNNGPWKILKYDSNGSNPQLITDSLLGWPQDIIFLEDSNWMLVSRLMTNSIAKHDATTGRLLGIFAAGMSGPTRMKIGPDSALYVLQWSGNGRVKRYDLNGNFLNDFTTIGVPQSIGMDWDSIGNLYVSSYNGDYVRKFDTSGVNQGLFVSTNLAGPTNIWFNDQGELIVSDYDGGAIKKFSSTGSYLGLIATGLRQNEGVEFLPNGNMLIGNGFNGSVREYDTSNVYLGNFISPGLGGLIRPNAVRLRYKTLTSISKNEIPFQTEYKLIQDQIHINGPLSSTISLYDPLGRMYLRTDCAGQCVLPLPKIHNGVYLLQIRQSNQISKSFKIYYQKD